MTVEFVDPRAEPGVAIEPYALRLDAGRADLTIGVVANGFPDSVAFLEELAPALRDTLPGARVVAFAKPNPSVVANDTLLDAMAAECDGVVAAYGH